MSSSHRSFFQHPEPEALDDVRPDGIRLRATAIFEATREGAPEDGVKLGTEAGEELKAKIGGSEAEFFGDFEIAPEPVSSTTGVATDGLGGYVAKK